MPKSSIKYDRNERNGEPMGQRRPLKQSVGMSAQPTQSHALPPRDLEPLTDRQSNANRSMTSVKTGEHNETGTIIAGE
ncbi:hypothetical protein EKL30_14860 [Candidimonas sp. SYP-B2681]|uniref:hypothetical protein n=1 Tax=Candidimonas sp. SYP-B2681 TaxID=2497686 RepID=UPI000F886ED4|nr:hypothetical protein [Candidimonas sp. SYP-B2681]RTZ40972.1 hypothetical protein EKL30_14860 [Candidimonas sp. SYP-B2681]